MWHNYRTSHSAKQVCESRVLLPEVCNRFVKNIVWYVLCFIFYFYIPITSNHFSLTVHYSKCGQSKLGTTISQEVQSPLCVEQRFAQEDNADKTMSCFKQLLRRPVESVSCSLADQNRRHHDCFFLTSAFRQQATIACLISNSYLWNEEVLHRPLLLRPPGMVTVPRRGIGMAIVHILVAVITHHLHVLISVVDLCLRRDPLE